MKDIAQLRTIFDRQGILIAFNGAFTHSLIEELGNAAKTYLQAEKIAPQQVIDVFAVYVEQTQNVRNYSVRRELKKRGKDAAIVVIGYEDKRYTVSAGNYILKSDVPDLKSRLDTLSGLDKKGLRKAYKEQLRRDHPPEATGAGLGLLDIARRATAPMEYHFDAVDDEYDYFILEVSVAGES